MTSWYSRMVCTTTARVVSWRGDVTHFVTYAWHNALTRSRPCRDIERAIAPVATGTPHDPCSCPFHYAHLQPRPKIRNTSPRRYGKTKESRNIYYPSSDVGSSQASASCERPQGKSPKSTQNAFGHSIRGTVYIFVSYVGNVLIALTIN